jgi:hypothetical protein
MDFEILLSEVTAILKPYGIEKIILFGSYAYGTIAAARFYRVAPLYKDHAIQSRGSQGVRWRIWIMDNC